jgi:hypothetical protein
MVQLLIAVAVDFFAGRHAPQFRQVPIPALKWCRAAPPTLRFAPPRWEVGILMIW